MGALFQRLSLYSVFLLLFISIFNINAEPTSTPYNPSPTNAPTMLFEGELIDNLYGPEHFSTLDWSLSGAILFILCGIVCFCYLCIKHKSKKKNVSSEISVSSALNESTMNRPEIQKSLHKNPSKSGLTGPKVQKSFAHHEFQQVKQDSMVFDAAIVGFAMTKPDVGGGSVDDNVAQSIELQKYNHRIVVVEETTPLPQEAERKELEQHDEYEEYEEYEDNVVNSGGYSPLSQHEEEPLDPVPEIKLVKTKPPPVPKPKPKPPPVPKKEVVVKPHAPKTTQKKAAQPPTVPASILNKMNNNAAQSNNQNVQDKADENKTEAKDSVGYVSIEEAKTSIGTDREKLLNDEDFFTVFEMTKEDFYKLPKWKQVKAKKSKGLF